MVLSYTQDNIFVAWYLVKHRNNFTFYLYRLCVIEG